MLGRLILVLLQAIIGWFAARNARKTGVGILANLKRLAEAA